MFLPQIKFYKSDPQSLIPNFGLHSSTSRPYPNELERWLLKHRTSPGRQRVMRAATFSFRRAAHRQASSFKIPIAQCPWPPLCANSPSWSKASGFPCRRTEETGRIIVRSSILRTTPLCRQIYEVTLIAGSNTSIQVFRKLSSTCYHRGASHTSPLILRFTKV